MSTLTDKVRPLMKNGWMTMLALDQRGSLKTIIANGRDESTIADSQLSDFKVSAAEILSPLASAVLLDSGFGQAAMKKVPGHVPLILSADLFEQAPGGPVTKAVLDPSVTPQLIKELNPAALKLLIIWNKGSGADFRRDVVAKFVDLARKTGRISLVEGIVRDANGEKFKTTREHGEAVIDAARELVGPGPDVYKAEVPGYLPGQLGDVPHYARELTKAIQQPWVVLSNGVVAKDFPETVRLCCENGASGFLAGRAIWADAAAKHDPMEGLRSESVPRLRRLIDIVQSGQGARIMILLVAGQPIGGIIQFAYAVPDAEVAARSYAKDLNIGPWFLRGPLQARKPVYRGKPQDLRISVAIAYSGHMMVELIQQHDEQPSVYREVIERQGYGFHHYGIASKAFDADCADYVARGFELVFTDESPAGTRVAYFDAKQNYPGLIELIEIVPASVQRYEAMFEAAQSWDGKEIIRKV